MPLRQVYGKRRARGAYDPQAVFGDLQQKSSPEVKTVEVVPRPDSGRRDVFAEVDQNARCLAELSLGGGESQKRDRERKMVRRPRRKIVSESSDEENEVSPVRERLRSVHQSSGIEDVHDKSGDIIVVAQSPTKTSSATRSSRRRTEPDDDLPDMSRLNLQPPASPPRSIYHQHCAELLELSQHGLSDFTEWSGQLCRHLNITKIAEASFGEVYRLSLKERLSGFSSSDESVFKIIALRPPALAQPPTTKRDKAMLEKKMASMSAPTDVANEVKLLQRMSCIPGFTNFRDVRIVQGRPPPPFQKAYKSFNNAQKARKKDLSHFPDPAKKTTYDGDQLWAVIEMQDAGMDLERLIEVGEEHCGSVFFVWDVFWQVVLSLAKGEEGAEFEHRDLHLGNICVRRGDLPGDVNWLDKKGMKLGFTDAETTIIDYTISRALMPDGTVAHQDLASDSALFEGDSEEEYQYDIYRYMRGAVMLDDPYGEVLNLHDPQPEQRAWQEHHSVTNLIWLHYILYKMLEAMYWPSGTKAPPKRLKMEHAKWKRANDLEHVLLRMQELLDPGALCASEDLRAASDLVGLALREGWLDVEDVVGEANGLDESQREESLSLVAELEGLSLHAGRSEDTSGWRSR